MTKAILISLTNPVSKERDAEFNDWFDNVHGVEVTKLDGFEHMTRYRAASQVVPPGEPTHRYLAVYELSDVETAMKSLAEGREAFNMSDSVDLGGASGVFFEQIFTTKA